MHGRGGLGAPLPVAARAARSPTASILVTPTVVEVHADPPGRRRRPARRRLDAADGRRPELRGCVAGDRATCSVSATAASASSPGAPTSSRPAAARPGYRAALAEAGIAFDPTLIAVGGFTEETAAGAGARPARRSPTARRRSSPPTTCRRSRSCAPPRELGLARARRPVGRRLRQHPRVGAHRSAAHHGRPVDPGPRLRGRAAAARPHRPPRAPRRRRPIHITLADRARRASLDAAPARSDGPHRDRRTPI